MVQSVVPRPPRTTRRSAGFTLIDALTGLAALMIVVLLVTPGFRTALHRAKTAGFAQQMALLLQRARLEAMKEGRPIAVAVSGDALVSSAGGETLGTAVLPTRVRFEAARGFGDSEALRFRSDGSADRCGAFRIVDDWKNHLEVAIDLCATGEVEVRKRNASGLYVAEQIGGEAWTFE